VHEHWPGQHVKPFQPVPPHWLNAVFWQLPGGDGGAGMGDGTASQLLPPSAGRHSL
jgi:hypothetical protein